MSPIDFEGTNITLTKPEDMTDEECQPLKAMFIEQGKFSRFLTAWKPSPADLAALNRGEPLYHTSLGTTFAPIGMFTMNENGEANI